MLPDRSRFFVFYPDGREEDLSSAQFCAFVVSLRDTKAYTFDRPFDPTRLAGAPRLLIA